MEVSRRFALIYTLIATMWFMSAAMLDVENDFLSTAIPALNEKLASGGSESGFEQYYPKETYKFHEMIYFMIVSMVTVGYGDIFPFTNYGRALIILTIAVMLGLLPIQLQALVKVQSLTSKYARVQYKSKKDSKHIIVLGNAPPDDIKMFLNECYHQDHGQSDIIVIIMRNSAPSKELVDILNTHSGRAIYLEGNPLDRNDLKRAVADQAT